MNIKFIIKNLLCDPATGIRKRQSLKRILNYFLSLAQYYLKHSFLFGMPIYITIDVSNFCQLRCPLCPRGQGLVGREKKNIPFKLFKKIIDELAPYAYGADLHNWGEPFFNPDIFKMIKYAAGKGLFNNISTNFQIPFKNEDFDNLVNSGLQHLIVSLDGACEETYQKYRIGGTFKQVIENIKGTVNAKNRLSSRSPFITLQFLVNKHNEGEIEKVNLLAKALRVDRLSLSPIMVNIKDDAEVNQWLPTDQNYSCYDYKERIKKRKQKNCNWPWLRAAINPDGRVSPCCHLYHSSTDFGDINQEKFRTIWNNEKFRKSRQFLKEKKPICGIENISCFSCLKPWIEHKTKERKERIDLVNESLTNKIKI